MNRLKRPLEKLNQNISGLHFEVGKGLHINTFYHAKNFFQYDDNAKDVAKNLADLIKSKINDPEHTTLVGFSNYSALFLKHTVAFLKEMPDGLHHINYGVIDKNGDDFSYSLKPELEKQVIIILPVTRTFERYFKIREFIESDDKSVNVLNVFFNVFLILDEDVDRQVSSLANNKVLNIASLADQDTRTLYKRYLWDMIDNNRVTFKTDDRSQDKNNAVVYYIDRYTTKLYLADRCSLCFPKEEEKFKSSYQEEHPLVISLDNHDSLKVIFGLPKFAGSPDIGHSNLSFNKLFQGKQGRPIHIYGNINVHNVGYLNFIQRDVFYSCNEEHILKYFVDELEGFRNEVKNQSVIIITPWHSKSSGFLEDMVQIKAFGENNISIFPFHQDIKFYEDFDDQFLKIVETEGRIIYFDDVVAGGVLMRMISDYLENASFKAFGSEKKRVFDLVVTLIDRTTLDYRAEIDRRMSGNLIPKLEKQFLYFFKLNVPQIESDRFGNPLKQRFDILKQMFEVCHLDALKLYVRKEFARRSPKKVHEFVDEYQDREDAGYFPFVKTPQIFEFYQSRYTFAQRNLNKLRFFHEISSWLVAHPNGFDRNDLNLLLHDLTTPDKLKEYFQIDGSEVKSIHRNRIIEINLVKTEILKILSRPPFRDYNELYKTVFMYNNEQLYKTVEKIHNHQEDWTKVDPNHDDFTKRKVSFELFHELRTYIKRSVELNSNFIISLYFLEIMRAVTIDEDRIYQLYIEEQKKLVLKDPFQLRKYKNYDYQSAKVVDFKYFLLFCYKELIFKNPARSIHLETLLNLPELHPLGGRDKPKSFDQPLEKVIGNPYYQLRRIIKAENIYLLNNLIEDLINHNKFISNLMNAVPDQLFKYPATEDSVRLLLASIGAKEDNSEKMFFAQLNQSPSFIENCRQVLVRHSSNFEITFETIKQMVIKEWLSYNYLLGSNTEETTLRQARTFIHTSTHMPEDDNVKLSSSILSTLYSVAQLHNTEGFKIETGDNIQFQEDIFIKKIQKVLRSVSDIIGEDVSYACYICYGKKERKEEKQIDNIFTVVSNDNNGTWNTNLKPGGLIYHMLNGMEDFPKGNLQTFLAIARPEENKVLSFKDEYYSCIEGESNKIVVADALMRDCAEKDPGFKIIERAKMMLLFRLADIDLEPGSNQPYDQGKAVFAICSSKIANTQNFYAFANVEKMRLLLLIKEQMLKYLKRQFDSDAFLALMENKKIFQYQEDLNHGIGDYEFALSQFRSTNNEIIKKRRISKEDFFDLKNNELKSQIVIQAILGQIQAGKEVLKELIEVTPEEFREMLEAIITDGTFGGRSYKLKQFKLPEFYPPQIDRYIYEVVIPELVINMKAHAWAPNLENPLLKIDFKNNCFSFINNRKPSEELNIGKKRGGWHLCSKIVAQLGYNEMQHYLNQTKDVFEVSLNLNEQII